MSSGGTASSLHSHAHHQLHCILHGRKDFILIDSQYKPDLHFTEKVNKLLILYVTVDLQAYDSLYSSTVIFSEHFLKLVGD